MCFSVSFSFPQPLWICFISQGVIVGKLFSPPAKQQPSIVCSDVTVWKPEMNTSGLHIAADLWDLRIAWTFSTCLLLFYSPSHRVHSVLFSLDLIQSKSTKYHTFKFSSFFMFWSDSPTELVACGDIHTLPCGRFESFQNSTIYILHHCPCLLTDLCVGSISWDPMSHQSLLWPLLYWRRPSPSGLSGNLITHSWCEIRTQKHSNTDHTDTRDGDYIPQMFLTEWVL